MDNAIIVISAAGLLGLGLGVGLVTGVLVIRWLRREARRDTAERDRADYLHDRPPRREDLPGDDEN